MTRYLNINVDTFNKNAQLMLETYYDPEYHFDQLIEYLQKNNWEKRYDIYYLIFHKKFENQSIISSPGELPKRGTIEYSVMFDNNKPTIKLHKQSEIPMWTKTGPTTSVVAKFDDWRKLQNLLASSILNSQVN